MPHEPPGRPSEQPRRVDAIRRLAVQPVRQLDRQPAMPYWILRYLVVILAFAGLLWLGWRLRSVLLLIVVALVVTATFRPVIGRLQRFGFSRTAAVATTFLLIIGGLLGFLAYLAPLLVEQARALVDALPYIAERFIWIRERWQGWRAYYDFLPAFTAIRDWLIRTANAWLQLSVAMTGQLVTGAVSTVAMLVTSFFFLKDGERLLSALLRPLPFHWRQETPTVLARAGERVGDYMLGRLTMMACVGALTTIGLWAIGVPYFVLLGFIAFLLDIVPYIGPILAGVIGVLVGFSQSWQVGLWTLGLYVVIQQTENWLLEPVIIGRSVGLHPVWVLLAVIAGAELMGVGGMILAVPVVTTVLVLFEEWWAQNRPAQAVDDEMAPPEEERRAA
jgi:predicted PurR-regulated permease PerM